MKVLRQKEYDGKTLLLYISGKQKLVYGVLKVKRTRIRSTVRYELRNLSHVIRRTTFSVKVKTN